LRAVDISKKLGSFCVTRIFEIFVQHQNKVGNSKDSKVVKNI